MTVLDDPGRPGSPGGGLCFCPGGDRSGWKRTEWNWRRFKPFTNKFWKPKTRNATLVAHLEKLAIKSCRIAQQDRIGK